jgi:5-(carboxyamino)imidazole ribonucleotide synthase
VLEQFLTLECELSVVLARNEVGFVQPFPVAENQHISGVLDITIAPARVAPAVAAQALLLATNMAMALNYVGVMAVEFFVVTDANGEPQLLINEIAPRPHNSGHFTMDACRTSQFEQQVRVLCGLPLGDASQHTPAVMLNLLGDLWSGDAHEKPPAWDKILQFPNAHLHLYGKRSARPGRKMGHVTVCGATVNAALQDILKIKQMLAEK